MSVSIEKQIQFYDWQINELDKAWGKYLRSSVIDLYESKQLFIGRIWGFDAKRGVLIIRFKNGMIPRLKVPLTISYPKKSIGPLREWKFSYGEYRNSYVEYFSDCSPIFFLENKKNEPYRYIGLKNVSLDFIRHISNDLREGNKTIVILGEMDPPREYLLALKKFTELNPNNKILAYSSSGMGVWKPKNLAQLDLLVENTVKKFKSNKYTVIQGPPGTGKTYLIAKVCEQLHQENKRICITSLTHKALMEAAIKEGMHKIRVNNDLYKVNISSDESALIPEMQSHNVDQPLPYGGLLLTTYFSLSKLLKGNTSNDKFDYLIIEEASQAFLTTIAGFSSLAKNVLIVGDFMQLQPIVLEKNKAINIDANIQDLIGGLRTFSLNNQEFSHRLVNTHRLSSKASLQTGTFYDDSLRSVSDRKGIDLSGGFAGLFCPNGGASYLAMKNFDEGLSPTNAIQLIIKLVSQIREEYPSYKIAVLSAFKKTVNSVIDDFLAAQLNLNQIEVNTVDRIQGMTVDICIYLIPSNNLKFSFDDNRFNVATSRAKRGTLIISEDSTVIRSFMSSAVGTFIDRTFRSKINE